MDGRKIGALVLIGIIIGSSVLVYYYLLLPAPPEGPVFKGGTIIHDETWSGSILVNESIVVPSGVTLTINPGTRILFAPSRDYRNQTNVGLTVAGGTVRAIGTPEQQIWFTSDADEPINGDWAGIELHNTNTSVFKYVIVEFSGLGISQFDSKANISHSIVRWVNAEGIYMERSSPVIEYNLLYQNGYHEIALEQYNYDVIIRNNIFAGGHIPFIVFDSSVILQGNYFHNYGTPASPAISVAGTSDANVTGNKFDGFNNDTAILKLQPMSTLVQHNNDFGNGSIPIPELDFADNKDRELGYTPGDPEDQYMYVFPEEDETRRVVKRIGLGLGFGWAFEYANGYLWKLGSGDLVRIDPSTGNSTTYSVDTSQVLGPRGLCYDGEYFWAQDHSLLRIVKFKVNATDVTIYDSFPIPENETGARQSLSTDGTYLYIPDRTGTKMFELFKNGTINREIAMPGLDLVGPITWNGTCFWTGNGQHLYAFSKDGTIVGRVYDVARGISGITWDGSYLWGLYKTCELWNDAKMFQVEILNDSLI
ncbi:MAG: right-handed parallel beta-helix repeat-containing protein [Promethearchaeota archaeon]